MNGITQAQEITLLSTQLTKQFTALHNPVFWGALKVK
jgi:hypothetical protein